MDSIVVEDILISNQRFNMGETLYDIDCFQRIVDYFVSIDESMRLWVGYTFDSLTKQVEIFEAY